MAAPACFRTRFASLCRNLVLDKTPFALTACCNEVPLITKWQEASTCSANVTRSRKRIYPRTYKVRLVQPDGSSFSIRYRDPLKIITQPVDPATMTEEQRKARMKRLRPEKPKKIYEVEDVDDGDYDQRSWSRLLSKR